MKKLTAKDKQRLRWNIDSHGARLKNSWYAFTTEIYTISRSKGFYGKKFNDAEKIALMHSELSEALEGLRSGKFPGKPDDKLPHRPMVEVELADLIHRVMNYARHRNLDVVGALIEKAQFNLKRPHKHGKNF